MQISGCNKLELTVDVLDGVLAEIVGGTDLRDSAVLAAFRSLSRDQINRLDRLCTGNGRASLEELAFVERVFFGANESVLMELQRDVEEFENVGLVQTSGQGVHFAGDEREALYAKYYARKIDARFSVSSTDLSTIGAVAAHADIADHSSWEPFTTHFLFN
jgi:hypothetical protein